MATTKKKGTSKQARRGVVNSLSSTMKPRPLSERDKTTRVIKVPATPRPPKSTKPQVPTRDADQDETGLGQLDPKTTPARDATHFRRIIAARQKVAMAEAELRKTVQEAHAAGDSWTVIGMALDTSRQAAFQRFGKS